MSPVPNAFSDLFNYCTLVVPDQATAQAPMTNAVSYAAAATTAGGPEPNDIPLQPSPSSDVPVPPPSSVNGIPDAPLIDQSAISSPHFALTVNAPQGTRAPDTSVDGVTPGSPSAEAAVATTTPADLQASLLLQPFAANTVAPACTSPLDMLIAALEPAPTGHAFTSECSTANAYQSAPNTATAIWSPDGAGHAEYAPFPWTAGQSAQPIGRTLGRPQDGLANSSYSGIPRESARKTSQPAGIKRPYTEFDNLLSAADMYANGQIGDPIHSPSKQPRLQPAPQPPALVSGPSYAGDPATSPYTSVGVPQSTAAVDSVTAAAAAAAAAASMAYSAAFPYSTKRSTVAVPDPTMHLQYPSMCFGSLPAPSQQQPPPPPPLGHPHTYPHIAPPQAHPPMHMSFHMGSSDASVHPLPAGYLFGNAGGPAMAHAQHPLPEFLATTPIPAIPGQTPRRVSIPDLTPTAEEERIGAKARPRRQKLRFHDDLYTPMWGFCDTCAPGKWLQLKNSAYWYHKQFFHGISSVSGRPFVRPLQARHFDADIIEGLCHQCRQWRRNSVLWFRHAHKCHVYHKPKPENETDGSDISPSAAGVPATNGPNAGTALVGDDAGDGSQQH
ncbi:hypothetical protein DL89DRAFT_266429 [Linderina pennispora]|uniref:Transcription regulator Rua1 C-terminal domain-containing protein n=1 Tax=Linderina pennispora TaxID=61395 RepID=A0A1Y1WD24_9FUNG|nr:uncharacterized protein DL89DRAFT_266429 [Linderina pennispora]ORX71431.1 hypothetical protein DL89DRAFT_266429 [Linderina pennispora]